MCTHADHLGPAPAPHSVPRGSLRSPMALGLPGRRQAVAAGWSITCDRLGALGGRSGRSSVASTVRDRRSLVDGLLPRAAVIFPLPRFGGLSGPGCRWSAWRSVRNVVRGRVERSTVQVLCTAVVSEKRENVLLNRVDLSTVERVGLADPIPWRVWASIGPASPVVSRAGIFG